MLKLTSSVTELPVWVESSAIVVMEQVEAFTNDHQPLGIVTVLYVGGATWYVKESPQDIQKMREQHTRKAVGKLREFRKEIEREDWEDEGD